MNIKAVADKIGIDYEKTVEDFCGDVSALSSRLQAFASSNAIETLKTLQDKADAAGIKKLAHGIRKDAEKVGLETVAKASRRVEDADTDKLKSAVHVLIEKMEEAISAIKNQEEEK